MTGKKHYGYWRDWSNVEPELKRLMNENGGRIPTYQEFLKLGRCDLAHAIQRHHGGLNGIRKKLRIKNHIKRKNNSLKDFEYVKGQIYEIVEAHPELNGEFPSSWWMQQNGYNNIYQAIRIYHRGMRRFREAVGEKQVILENGSWRNLEFVLDQIKQIMRTHGFSDPPEQFRDSIATSEFLQAYSGYLRRQDAEAETAEAKNN